MTTQAEMVGGLMKLVHKLKVQVMADCRSRSRYRQGLVSESMLCFVTHTQSSAVASMVPLIAKTRRQRQYGHWYDASRCGK